MSFFPVRRHAVVLSCALAVAGSVVAIGCGGDDVDTQSDQDGDAAADAGLTLDSSIVVNVDSGKPRDSGVIADASDASDDATLCPDGAPGTMCPSDAGLDAD